MSIQTPNAAATPRILVLEPDPAVLTRLLEAFTLDGCDPVGASTLASAGDLLASDRWDLALLSMSEPNRSDLQLLQQIRSGTISHANDLPNLPLIVISSMGLEAHRIQAFELGCDDYIVKPYSFGELRGRVAAVLRRSRSRSAGSIATIGDLRIDYALREVSLAGKKITLTSKEYELLTILAKEPCRVYERAYLLNKIWGTHVAGSTRTLDVHACRLRAKLAGSSQPYIANVWGVGYRLQTPATR